MEERYDELKLAIDYLSGLGVTDPLRPGNKIKFFHTSIGLDPEINRELKEAFGEGEALEGLKQCIRENKAKIIQLGTDV